MEFTRHETETLILALSIAIDKENKALQDLINEKVKGLGSAIRERERHLESMDVLRTRFKRLRTRRVRLKQDLNPLADKSRPG